MTTTLQSAHADQLPGLSAQSYLIRPLQPDYLYYYYSANQKLFILPAGSLAMDATSHLRCISDVDRFASPVTNHGRGKPHDRLGGTTRVANPTN